MKLYVKYCGGCNPMYDRSGLVREAAALLGAELSYEQPEMADMRLLVSGCDRNCVGRHHGGLSCIQLHASQPPDVLVESMKQERMW